MALLLILFPIGMAGVAYLLPGDRGRGWLLPVTGVAHLALTGWILRHDVPISGVAWLLLDPPGRLVLLVISVLFCFCGFYTAGYLRYRAERSSRVFCSCLLALLGVMTLVTWAHHLGLMWIAVETAALTAAPLIYFNRTPRSIEATWKYLLVGSVGIALALLGSFFLAYASLHEGYESSLLFDELVQQAPDLSKPWLHAAFILLVVGYGTKMGLAPMHTWKPDAYGEAPGVVGALLAGGVTSCAYLAILRVYHVCYAAGEGVFASKILVFMGLLSMAVAGIFMVGQRDFKRLLAYSSVEHMGILTLGMGIGGGALFGALLHLVNNGLAKGVMFLSAGNIHRAYNAKTADDVRGALRHLPVSGALFLAGFIAITGAPPFGPFISEFTILNAMIGSGRYVVCGLFLFFMLVVFIGMSATVLAVVQGRPHAKTRFAPYRDGFLTAAPILALMTLVLLLGLYIPSPLHTLVSNAAVFLQERP